MDAALNQGGCFPSVCNVKFENVQWKRACHHAHFAPTMPPRFFENISRPTQPPKPDSNQ
jgi:hypothetical protein